MRRHLVWFIFAFVFNTAAAEENSTACPPREQPERMVSICDADPETCAVWRRFRQERPYPYQVIAFIPRSEGDKITLIFSEVPPLGTSEEVSRLLRTVLGVPIEDIHRLRYPVGLDGWLEDLVISVPSGGGTALAVPEAQGGTVAVSATLAERLQFLNTALFGASGLLYLDALVPEGAASPLPNIRITAGELLSIAAAKDFAWQPLLGPGAQTYHFDQLAGKKAASLFIDTTQLLVAIVIPANTDVKDIRGAFRQFALSSDFLVGSVRPKKGGLILLGRNRMVPLRMLPPLRFESLQAMARSNQALGQSYERQRIFSGKITKGKYSGWDWAPIYLTAQLQDTEFGTLLNIADQQLKSWSECGGVRYAFFDYPVPPAFPFEKSTATNWFFTETQSTSLIFNWNTNGFSTATNMPVGRVVTASGSTALPVSYILPTKLDDPVLDSIPRWRAFQLGLNKEAAVTGSRKGSAYFLGLGDPVLTRVAQNVLLFQMLNDAMPFRIDHAKGTVPASPTRSELVSKLLSSRTAIWLQNLQRDPAMQHFQGRQAIATLKSKAGMSDEQIAQLLATPEKQGQQLLRLHKDIELKKIALIQLTRRTGELATEFDEILPKAKTEFKTKCKRIGGDIQEQGATLKCSYTAEKEDVERKGLATSYDNRLAALERESSQIVQEQAVIFADLRKQVDAFELLIGQDKAADAIADDLRQLAGYSSDLDTILTEVLAVTRQTESHHSIQTPTVVLSQNTMNIRAVGGHNIDALPWLVKTDTGARKASLSIVDGRPILNIGKEEAGNGASIARAMASGSEVSHGASVSREAAQALELSDGPRSNFLGKLARLDRNRLVDTTLLERAKLCACDVYIEGGDAEMMTIVRFKPPPPAPPRIVFGHSAAIDSLAAIPGEHTTLFANVSKQRASAISESAARTARLARAQLKISYVDEQIAIARNLFQEGVQAITESLTWRTKSGKSLLVGDLRIAQRGKLVASLKNRPGWNLASVFEVGGLDRSANNSVALIEVRFGDSGTSVVPSIEVHVYDANGTAHTAPAIAVPAKAARDAIRKMGPNDSLLAGIDKLAEQIYKDSKDVDSVEFFLKTTGSDTVLRYRRDTAPPELQLARRHP